MAEDNDCRHFHFVGICGTAMGAVAAAMKERGCVVSGSDEHVYEPMAGFLKEKGIVIAEGYASENIPPQADMVVIGNAMSRGNPEVEAILERRIAYTSLPQLLKDEFLWGRRNLVVTGTHGKTTTASMLAHLLRACGRDPGYMIGGIARDLGRGCSFSGSEFFVLEGDEYDTAFFDKRSKFVHYLPEVVIINNIEFDHADIFEDLDAIKKSFRNMLNIVPGNGAVLVNGDDEHALEVAKGCHAQVLRVGFDAQCERRITDVEYGPGISRFTVHGISCEIPMDGEFNVRNAAMALCAACFVGLEEGQLSGSLAGFSGVARRQELRGEEAGVKVIDDFGHHPTAIRATLGAIRQRYPGSRIWALFEPRSNTSRRNLMQDELVEALSMADGVFVCPVTDSGKVPEGQLLDVGAVVEALAGKGRQAFMEPGAEAIVTKLKSLAEAGDTVVVLSNGGFDGIHVKLLQALGEEQEE
ncbi:MAG: UDP-N-acetylmuramate:L-alanyl-gamma-D-glutamyl-meso-diaminopimelate ligase [Verrucomicrobiota bacterium]|nr:UDP-N-acetylmuramate:L-alanyl-gamma-D-glutamyl-meso-diaminopimelate ligase [Verrucomicrobiota bacterium]